MSAGYRVFEDLQAWGYPVTTILTMTWPPVPGGVAFAYKFVFTVQYTHPKPRYQHMTLIAPLDVTAADLAKRYHEHVLRTWMDC